LHFGLDDFVLLLNLFIFIKKDNSPINPALLKCFSNTLGNYLVSLFLSFCTCNGA
jgi:hypothetical protein